MKSVLIRFKIGAIVNVDVKGVNYGSEKCAREDGFEPNEKIALKEEKFRKESKSPWFKS